MEEQPAKGTDEVAQSKKEEEKEKKKHQQETNKEGEVSRVNEEGADTGVKGCKLKRKRSKPIPGVDYDDPRFSSLFTSPLFALDPTHPQCKRSAAHARQLAHKQGRKGDGDELMMRGKEAEKLQRKQAQPPHSSEVPEANEKADELPSKREKQELSSLVRSIKTKSKKVKKPSNGNVPREIHSENTHLNKEDRGREHEISSLVLGFCRIEANLLLLQHAFISKTTYGH